MSGGLSLLIENANSAGKDDKPKQVRMYLKSAAKVAKRIRKAIKRRMKDRLKIKGL